MTRIVLIVAAMLALSACTKPKDDWGGIARSVGQIINQP